ncbi:MAG: helix-turn-helix domain-containing protein [bacterium]
MKAKEVEALKSFLQAVGASPEEVRVIIRAADNKDKAPIDKLILTREAAAILECHPKTVFRYRRRGLLNPVRRSARCIRWRESEVRRLAFGEVAA